MNVASLQKLASSLRQLPKVVAQRVAKASAPAITASAGQTFAASENAYGVPWAPGADGQKVTLRKTGALASTLRYVAIGTKLRVALGVPYAKFQIGKRPVFPAKGVALPPAYADTLTRTTADVVRAEMRGAL